MLPKIRIPSKKGSNKSCSVYKKSTSAFVYLPLEWSYGTRKIDELEILYFNLELNDPKNMHPIKKGSNESCSELNFV